MKLSSEEKSALIALHKKQGINQKAWEAQLIAEKGREELARYASKQITASLSKENNH